MGLNSIIDDAAMALARKFKPQVSSAVTDQARSQLSKLRLGMKAAPKSGAKYLDNVKKMNLEHATNGLSNEYFKLRDIEGLKLKDVLRQEHATRGALRTQANTTLKGLTAEEDLLRQPLAKKIGYGIKGTTVALPLTAIAYGATKSNGDNRGTHG